MDCKKTLLPAFRLTLTAGWLLLVTTLVYSQEKKCINRLPSAGMLIDYPLAEEILPESIDNGYRPFLLQGFFRAPMLPAGTGKHQLTLYVTPQFNIAMPITGYKRFHYEAGINIGLAYEFCVGQVATFFGGISAGPHFINIETSLQSGGFIFSDNLFGGIHQIVNDKWMITYQIKLRHMSNAGIKNPNVGIDNVFAGLGLSYFLFGKRR